MEKKYLYVETYGCQMNEYDSDRIRTALSMETTDNPKNADVVIVNTCAIRDKADQKAFSSIGRLKHLKKKKPEMIIGVAGCVAQLYGEKLIDKMPHLDLVLGPRAIPKLPRLIEEIHSERRRSVETSLDIEDVFGIEPYHEEGKVTAFVSVQQGCNKKCAYCIVPYVRGGEINRSLEDILREARILVGKGVKEITLIGQTVNSWKADDYKFGDLLRILAEVEGIERIRYTTSYPRDVTKKMVDAVADTQKVSRHIHLPVQSGSNSVLRGMNRTYTREWYLDAVARLRDAVPDMAFSTDIIVGFPGESDEDFDWTMKLMEEVEFDGAFSFKYSPRPGTPAADFERAVPDEVQSLRLSVLQEFQREITSRKNSARVGKIEQALVEGESRNDANWISGRTSHNRIVNFPGDLSIKGKIVNVKITEGFQNSLRGEIADKFGGGAI